MMALFQDMMTSAIALLQQQPGLTINLTGFGLLIIILIIGAYNGYQQGLRNILTIALWSIIAYILTVQGGDTIVAIINRFWTNLPRLLAFLIGNDPDAVAPFGTLISDTFQVPLFFRAVAFIGIVLLGTYFNRKAAWKGPPREALARPLGAFVGALIALLWTNAVVVFWNNFVAEGGQLTGPLTGTLATILNLLPDLSVLMPSLITVFFIIIGGLILFNFPKVWRP
jgi:hypothetical protein